MNWLVIVGWFVFVLQVLKTGIVIFENKNALATILSTLVVVWLYLVLMRL